jgi:hypothetical protein
MPCAGEEKGKFFAPGNGTITYLEILFADTNAIGSEVKTVGVC